jgi:5-methylcytosine-specific restriction protein A
MTTPPKIAKARANFSKPVKRAALARSGGLCEASGAFYGLDEGKRCNVSLAYGVEYDHENLQANSKDSSLENCRAVCPSCHRFKTRTVDIPKAAKTVRQQDKDRGIVKPKGQLRGPQFTPSEKPPREPKQALPPRRMFEEI